MFFFFFFQNEMCALKSDNDRLQRMVQSSQTINNSQGSLIHHNRTSSESIERTISLSENTSIGKIIPVFQVFITKTCPYNFDLPKPHLYIVKLGFTGVYIIFLVSAQKHRLWVLVRTASVMQF